MYISVKNFISFLLNVGKKQILNMSTLKNFNYMKNKIEGGAEDVENVILGSSHSFYGIDEKCINKKTINISYRSQDLYYSYKLIKKYIGVLKNLKKVVVFYSVFSPGFSLQQTIEKETCSYYKCIFGIDYKNQSNLEPLIKIEKKFNNQSKKTKEKCRKNPFKNLYSEQIKNDNELLKSRTSKHLRENRRTNEENKYIKKLKKICDKFNVELYLVFSPATQDYKNMLPKSDVLFKDINRIISEYNIKDINLYDDNDFVRTDFFDYDHLNREGAIKCTKKVLGFMGQNTKDKSDVV